MEHPTLAQLKPGQQAVVRRLLHTGGMRRRLQELGLLPGALVTCVGQSPGGDPMAYELLGAVVAIRRRDGEKVLVFLRKEEEVWA